MAASKHQLNEPDYQRWLKGIWVIKLLKEGTEGYIEQAVQRLHGRVIQTVKNRLPQGVELQCAYCTITYIKSVRNTKWNCPTHSICSDIHAHLIEEHQYRKLNLDNTDVRAWPDVNRSWEEAKCYMSPGYQHQKTASETDCIGLLGLIRNCKFVNSQFSPSLTNIFEEVRTWRNAIMHSASYILPQADLDDLIKKVLVILEDPQKLKNVQAAKEAVKQIKYITSTQFTITSSDEADLLRDTMKAIQTQLQQVCEHVSKLENEQALKHQELSQNKLDTNELLSHLNTKIHVLLKRVEELEENFSGKRFSSAKKRRHATSIVDESGKEIISSNENEGQEEMNHNGELCVKKQKATPDEIPQNELHNPTGQAFLKSLKFLGKGKESREIIAGTYLKDGQIAFLDRPNSQLLITDTDVKHFNAIDLVCVDKENNKAFPSDVNKGLKDGELLITFTHKLHSSVIVYKLINNNEEIDLVRQFDLAFRTRTVAILDDQHFVTTDREFVHVLDDGGNVLTSHRRNKKDRLGLVMSSRFDGRFYYGDGDDFVCCQYEAANITEVFRFKNRCMGLPRGSAIGGNGNIFVCCNETSNVFMVSPDGLYHRIAITAAKRYCGYRAYKGDIDFHPDGRTFFITFWKSNQWPILYRIN